MTDSASPNTFERIQSLCRDYRRQLKHAAPARIEDYLDRVYEDSREMLFQNLLHIDIQFQRRQQREPTSEEYIRRFPQYAGLVRNAFFESTLMTQSPLVNTPSIDETHVFAVPAARRLGEYELLRELGRGSFGVVYEARHLQRHDFVALKTLPNAIKGPRNSGQEAERLHRFKREFRSLANINHPNLIGLHSLECDSDQWFFTMDMVTGTDFLSYVRPHGQLDETRLRQALGQLVAGVMALHANYVIHRDMKPSNVMVDQNGRVLILDFGLALEQHHASIAETAVGIAGTPAYMSPEQAMGETVTTACDWYAVGVILYESLSGRLPFTGSTLRLLQDKQHSAPPPFPENEERPEDLCQLCFRLLATRSEDRPQPAEIAQAVAATTGDPREQSHVRSGEHGLIGRESHLAQLHAVLETFTQHGQPVAVFVDGRSGEGKSSLCSAFLKAVRHTTECAVLSGRCYDRESVPFKALDTVIDAICGYLKGLPSSDVAAVLPRDSAVLQHIFPAFGRLKEIQNARTVAVAGMDEQEVRNRAFAAVRELLGRVSDRRPLIVFVDDLQWGDADSAQVMLQILRGSDAPQVFFLGTYRTDEADDSRYLQAWHKTIEQHQIHLPTHHISVGPLTSEQCTQLMADLLNAQPADVCSRAVEFCEQTGGNAFLFTELVGCFDPQSDSFRQMPVHHVIQEKLDRLPSEAQTLLHLISVSGQALRPDQMAAAADCAAVPMSTLNRMRSERLIRFVGEAADSAIDTYHDRIRESILTELELQQTMMLHRSLGEAIERVDGGLTEQQLLAVEQGCFDPADTATLRVFDLAFHFSAAGVTRKAFAYSVLAGEQACRQCSLESAATQYQAARLSMHHVTRAAQYQVLLKLGESRRLLGQYSEAESVLTQAHQLSANDMERCEVEMARAYAIREAGRYRESAERFLNALLSLGVTVPTTLSGRLAVMAGQALVQTFHTLFRYPRTGSKPADPRQTLIIQLLNGYVMSVWFRSTPAVLCTTLSVLNRAERSAVSRELCISWSLHGMVCMLMKLDGRGERYFRRSAAATSDDDFTTQTKSRLYAMVAHYSRARFDEAQVQGRQGLQVVHRSGESWLGLLLKLHMLLSEYRLGNLETALRGALEAFAESVRFGDPNTAHDYINFIAMMTGGRFRFPDMNAALMPIPDNIQATNQKLQAEARWHLRSDRLREAYQKAEEGWRLMKTHVVINHITNPNFPLLLEATRRYAAVLREDDAAAAQSLLKQGFRRAKWAARITNGTADYPATLRELGHFHHLRGNHRPAIRVTEQSCRFAELAGMKQELALSRLAVTKYQFEAGAATGEDCAAAQQAVAAFEHQIASLFQEHPLLL
ncbi:MAG: protein kinase [Planctomycetaceae bacterium]